MSNKPKVKIYLSKLPYDLIEEMCLKLKEKDEKAELQKEMKKIG